MGKQDQDNGLDNKRNYGVDFIETSHEFLYMRFYVKLTWNQDVFLKIGNLVLIGRYCNEYRYVTCESASLAQSTAILMFKKANPLLTTMNLKAKVKDCWVVSEKSTYNSKDK